VALPPVVLPPVVTQPVAPRLGAPPPLVVPRDGTGAGSGAGRAGSGAGRAGSGAGRAGSGAGRARGRRADSRRRDSGGRLSRIWQGSLRGSLGVCVIAGSAVIGAFATVVTHAQPGPVLALAVLAGTVAAALTVQPRTGRLIFPVPTLSYLIAALVAGVAYQRSSDKTELAVGAAQWIANGFFVMVLATLLAIALTTVRWFMWRRDQRGPVAAGWSAPGPPPYGGRGDPRPPGTQPSQQWPPGSQPTRGWDQRPGSRPGLERYNFSSGA
jgi:uncharacterized protein DUF6542